MRRLTLHPGQGRPIGGQRDFSPVLSALLRRLPNGGVLALAPGAYHFWPDKAATRTLYVSNTDSARFPKKRIGILMEGKKNITLRGFGARLVFHGCMTALALLRCEDVTLEGFTLEYACPPAIDATVQSYANAEGGARAVVSFPPVFGCAARGGQVYWQSEASPYTGRPYWRGKNGLDLTQHYERQTGRVYRTDEDLFHCCTHAMAGPGRLALAYSAPRALHAGDVFEMRRTLRDACGVLMADCRGVSARRLRVGYLYAMGVVAQNSADLSFTGCSFKATGAGRRSASGADMLHFSGCAGQILLVRCRFVNPHDDAVNVHGTFLELESAEGDALTLRYRHPQTQGLGWARPGERITFYNSATLLPVAENCLITEVRGPSAEDLSTVHVRVAGVPPLLGGARLVAENASRRPDVTIQSCRFEGIPTRGVLLSSGGRVRIVGNHFSHIEMACILIACDANEWFESGPVQDVFIGRNHFRDSGGPVLLAEPTNTRLCAQKVHRGIRVCRNRVTGMAPPYFLIRSAQILLRGNKLYGKRPARKHALV